MGARSPRDPDLPEIREQVERLEQLLIGDERNINGWKRKAVGTSRQQALAQIPTVGDFSCQIPIDAFRAIQRHIHGRQVNQAQWVREAIVARYLAEGGDHDYAASALAVSVDKRHRHVPGDKLPKGQSRRRVGHNGFMRP